MTNAMFSLDSELFASKQERDAFLHRYKELAHAKKLDARDALLRALLLGKDIKAAFPAVTRKSKLANGRRSHDQLDRAIKVLLRIPVDKAHLHKRLACEQSLALRFAGRPAFARRVEYARAALDAPLLVTERWGCNIEDEDDCSLGLSLRTFKKAQVALASLGRHTAEGAAIACVPPHG